MVGLFDSPLSGKVEKWIIPLFHFFFQEEAILWKNICTLTPVYVIDYTTSVDNNKGGLKCHKDQQRELST